MRIPESLPEGIISQDTWKVQDSTKIDCYQLCPRKYFYTYILGWRPDELSIHLLYGSAFHLAMESLLKHKAEGYQDKHIVEAFDIFLEDYRKNFEPEQDDANHPKNPERTLDALLKFVAKDKDKDYKVLYTEVCGAVPLSEEFALYFKIDSICLGPEGYFTFDHKTTTRNSLANRSQFDLSVQSGTYTHALYCLYPEDEVYGHKINFIALKRKTAKGDTEVLTIPVKKTPELMAAWQWNTLYYLNMLQWDLDNLSKCSRDDLIMRAFPLNPSSCTKYGLCPYHGFCSSRPNPLLVCDLPPPGFKVSHWDPRQQAETAHFVMDGNKLKEKSDG